MWESLENYTDSVLDIKNFNKKEFYKEFKAAKEAGFQKTAANLTATVCHAKILECNCALRLKRNPKLDTTVSSSSDPALEFRTHDLEEYIRILKDRIENPPSPRSSSPELVSPTDRDKKHEAKKPEHVAVSVPAASQQPLDLSTLSAWKIEAKAAEAVANVIARAKTTLRTGVARSLLIESHNTEAAEKLFDASKFNALKISDFKTANQLLISNTPMDKPLNWDLTLDQYDWDSYAQFTGKNDTRSTISTLFWWSASVNLFFILARVGWIMEAPYEYFTERQQVIAAIAYDIKTYIQSFMPRGFLGRSVSPKKFTFTIMYTSLLTLLDAFANLFTANITYNGMKRVTQIFFYDLTTYLPERYLPLCSDDELRAIAAKLSINLWKDIPETSSDRSVLVQRVKTLQKQAFKQWWTTHLLARPFYKLWHDMPPYNGCFDEDVYTIFQRLSIITTHVLSWATYWAFLCVNFYFLAGIAANLSSLPVFVPHYPRLLSDLLASAGAIMFYYALMLSPMYDNTVAIQKWIMENSETGLFGALYAIGYDSIAGIGHALKWMWESFRLAYSTNKWNKKISDKELESFLAGACIYWALPTLAMRIVMFVYLLQTIDEEHPSWLSASLIIEQILVAIGAAMVVKLLFYPVSASYIMVDPKNKEAFDKYINYLWSETTFTLKNTGYPIAGYCVMLPLMTLLTTLAWLGMTYLSTKIGHLLTDGEFNGFNGYEIVFVLFPVIFLFCLPTLHLHARAYENRRFEVSAAKGYLTFKGSLAGMSESFWEGILASYPIIKRYVNNYNGEYIDCFSEYQLAKLYRQKNNGNEITAHPHGSARVRYAAQHGHETCRLAEKPVEEFNALLRQWGIKNPQGLKFINTPGNDLEHVTEDDARYKRAFAFLQLALGMDVKKEVQKDSKEDKQIQAFFRLHAMVNRLNKRQGYLERSVGWLSDTILNNAAVISYGTAIVRFSALHIMFYMFGFMNKPELYFGYGMEPTFANEWHHVDTGSSTYLDYWDFTAVMLTANFPVVMPIVFFFNHNLEANTRNVCKMFIKFGKKLGFLQSVASLMFFTALILAGQDLVGDTGIRNATIALMTLTTLFAGLGMDRADEVWHQRFARKAQPAAQSLEPSAAGEQGAGCWDRTSSAVSSCVSSCFASIFVKWKNYSQARTTEDNDLEFSYSQAR